MPKSDNESWVVIFEFDESGYVEDDEKSSLDPAKILENIQKNTENANAERQEHGWKAFHANSWYTQHYYDKQTNNLTWAINCSEDNGQYPSVDYSVRILGAEGP